MRFVTFISIFWGVWGFQSLSSANDTFEPLVNPRHQLELQGIIDHAQRLRLERRQVCFFNVIDFEYQQNYELTASVTQSWHATLDLFIEMRIPVRERPDIRDVDSRYVVWTQLGAPLVQCSAEVIVAPVNALIPDSEGVFISVVKFIINGEAIPIRPTYS